MDSGMPARRDRVFGLVAALFAAGAALPAQAVEQSVARGDGAVLRALDKVEGRSRDLELLAGETGGLGNVEVTLRECRYPAADPASNAYAYLEIHDLREDAPRFAGWMIADSPALNALDHARYDVWVLRCTTS